MSRTLLKKIVFIIFTAGMIFYSQPAMSQPHFDWVRNYPIRGRAAAIDSSGYIYITGQSTNFYQKILKYDSLGNIIWMKDFNIATGSNYLGIAAYKSRYFYITYSNQDHSFGLSKFDTSGTLMWTRNISGYYYEPFCLTLDSSGNVYVSGEIDFYAANCFTVKYNPQGDTLWRAIYYPSTNGGAYTGRSISVDNQKNVYITGGISYLDFTYSYGTIKYDSLGNRKWISKYYSPYSPYSTAGGGSVKADNKGNCYVTGVALVNGNGVVSPVTIKYGPNGDSIWTRLFIFQDTIQPSGAYDMALDDNDNIYIPCNYTIKYDKNGNQLWYTRNNFYMNRVQIFMNDVYCSGGYWDPFIKLSGYNNNNGSLLFNVQYSTPYSVISGGILVHGKNIYHYAYALDSAILFKYSSNPSSISENTNESLEFRMHQNFPNPFNSSTTIKYSIKKNSFIKIQIFDINGREVKTIASEKKSPGDYQVKFEGSGLSSGVYFYSLFADYILIDTKKLIIVK